MKKVLSYLLIVGAAWGSSFSVSVKASADSKDQGVEAAIYADIDHWTKDLISQSELLSEDSKKLKIAKEDLKLKKRALLELQKNSGGRSPATQDDEQRWKLRAAQAEVDDSKAAVHDAEKAVREDVTEVRRLNDQIEKRENQLNRLGAR